jgi:general secretion pathway protein N
MSSRISLLALGLGVYLAVAIGSFPASLAYRWFGPQGLTLAAVEGTIWNGSAAYGSAAGLSLSGLRWELHPVALLTGKLSLSAEAAVADGIARTSLTASSERLELTDVRVSASLESFSRQLNLGDVSGKVNLSLSRLELVAGVPVAVAGTLTVADLYSAPLIPIEGVTTIPLGNFRAELTTGEQAGIVALVTDEGGPLELTGKITLAPDRSYSMDALIKPRAEAPMELVQGVELVTGEPNAEGRRRFLQQGSF